MIFLRCSAGEKGDLSIIPSKLISDEALAICAKVLSSFSIFKFPTQGLASFSQNHTVLKACRHRLSIGISQLTGVDGLSLELLGDASVTMNEVVLSRMEQ
jgi:hypothetical protein